MPCSAFESYLNTGGAELLVATRDDKSKNVAAENT